ncbi:MAG TPA: dienelactone hydrolase [Candidatus Accumulibacter sp.]|nr:MAG: putative dienelactone hydrolase [Candidatus Accumulibacter sp. SK-11]HAY27619.1 dienelactone hydrolase [Accumulibacter sp.]HCN66760.1 dienelactone hydrolase [Accumulibacter sp.]
MAGREAGHRPPAVPAWPSGAAGETLAGTEAAAHVGLALAPTLAGAGIGTAGRDSDRPMNFPGEMMRNLLARLLLVAVPYLLYAGTPASGAERPLLPATLNEELRMLPVGTGWSSVELETTLFVPPGAGPFPLVVINHGRVTGDPRFDPRARHLVASREFLRRGYVVAIPMRPGFSKSGGSYVDPRCDIESSARLQAETIIAVLRQLRLRPDIDPDRILLIGESEGGMGVMAAAATGFPGLRGVLNLAGGLRSGAADCLWQEALVESFAAFGRTSKVPSLWFYGDGGSHWGKELPRQLHRAYREAGGQAELITDTDFAGDAQALFASAQGVPIWWPESERFLREIGLPTEILFDVVSTPRPAPTGYAELSDSEALPYVDEYRRELYRRFLGLPLPRAFAIATTGNVGWAQGGTDPLAAALGNCERSARRACALYAVDDEVVWQAGEGSRSPATDPLREP